MGSKIELYTEYMDGFVSEKDLAAVLPEVERAHALLEKREGPGKEFLGWLDLPDSTDEELIRDIEGTAHAVRAKTDALIVVGIGGSYLGFRVELYATVGFLACFSAWSAMRSFFNATASRLSLVVSTPNAEVLAFVLLTVIPAVTVVFAGLAVLRKFGVGHDYPGPTSNRSLGSAYIVTVYIALL